MMHQRLNTFLVRVVSVRVQCGYYAQTGLHKQQGYFSPLILSLYSPCASSFLKYTRYRSVLNPVVPPYIILSWWMLVCGHCLCACGHCMHTCWYTPRQAGSTTSKCGARNHKNMLIKKKCKKVQKSAKKYKF